MKRLIALLILCVPVSYAHAYRLKAFSFQLTDISSRGLNADILFDGMERDSLNLKTSICSNRALIWGNDFKVQQGLDTAKIFMFYTARENQRQRSMWWYHVAPVVNERGSLWVLDAGFPNALKRPTTVQEWLESFSRSLNCKEMQAHHSDLAELIFNEQPFPKKTSHGTYDCYYIITPYYYWTPGQVAVDLLGRDEDGSAVSSKKSAIEKEELFQACVESRSSDLGYLLGQKRTACRAYVEDRL